MNESKVMGSNIENKELTMSIRRGLYLTVKRLFDIICSLIGCIFIIPIAIIVKICYVLTGDFKSIFYNHDRIGKNGKVFRFYKFRSMVYNADEILEKLLEENPSIASEYNANKKLENDPRVSKIGNFLRKTSLDEIPQFFNVLKGDMSLIGNRPYMPREKKDMGQYFADIVKTKPGLTGWWQVSGRSNLSFKKRLELESFYSNNCSILLDIKIFFKTIGVVLKHDGAQ